MVDNDILSFKHILTNHRSNLDIEHEDRMDGHTLLTYACWIGLYDFVQVLICDYNANFNHCNAKTNDFPLHCAICSNSIDILKYLLTNKADVFAQNIDGYNAMEHALALKQMECYEELKNVVSIAFYDKDMMPPTNPKKRNRRSLQIKKRKSKKCKTNTKKKRHSISKSSSNVAAFFRATNFRTKRSNSTKSEHITTTKSLDEMSESSDYSSRSLPSPPSSLKKSVSANLYQQIQGGNGQHPPPHHRTHSFSHSYAKRKINQLAQSVQHIPYQQHAQHPYFASHNSAPQIVNANYQNHSINHAVKSHLKSSKSRLFATSLPTKRNSMSKRNSGKRKGNKSRSTSPKCTEDLGIRKGACKSCMVLQREIISITNEKDILQQKLTNSIHGLVLQRELARKAETELAILKKQLQSIHANTNTNPTANWRQNSISAQPMNVSPNHSPSITTNEFDVDDDMDDDNKHSDIQYNEDELPSEREQTPQFLFPFYDYGADEMKSSEMISPNLEQSVTTCIDDEKSVEYDEEFTIMEGKEGVTMTQSEPPFLRTSSLFSFDSLDGGMDDDLLINLQKNTPTPQMPHPSESPGFLDLDGTLDEMQENEFKANSERWKVFKSSELSKLFSVLQYRTYCYCEREKRTSAMLKSMINNDKMYLMKMEELHSQAINEELQILKPVLHIETLAKFLKTLIFTEHNLDSLFAAHQQCHDIIYKSVQIHLKNNDILCRNQPVFNWYISDYQQMWIYQELFYNNFEKFLLNIATEMHNANIYCCHKNDFDEHNMYKHKVTTATSMTSKYKRTKTNICAHYVNEFGDGFDKRDTFFCSPKNPSRSFFKVFYDFDGNVSHLTDFLRASFVFDNFEDLYNALFVINDLCKKYTKNNKDGGGVGILKYKNSFPSDSKLNNGWRQIIINVPLCCGDASTGGSIPIICEIQLHFCLFWQFKDKTHRMYEISRLFKIRDHKTGKTTNLAMECAKQFYSKR